MLAKVPHSVFGVVRPKVAVFTTPNSDFNVLFPNLQGFRHPDHKFEWSREEFQSWQVILGLKLRPLQIYYIALYKCTPALTFTFGADERIVNFDLEWPIYTFY